MGGFPTLKYGDPNDLQDYQGARSDDDKKKEIETLMGLDDSVLDEKIAAEEKKIEEAESTFKAGVEKLQETYQQLMADKEETEAKVKAAGLGLMKSVKVAKKKAAAGSDEL